MMVQWTHKGPLSIPTQIILFNTTEEIIDFKYRGMCLVVITEPNSIE
jgi:hypothetical protein